MHVKNFDDLNKSEIWDLSENEDIIFTKKNTDNKRVLVNYKSYQILKKSLNQYFQTQLKINDGDQFDFNPFIEDLNTIVKNGNFTDIADQPHYFENLARLLKSNE